VAITPLWAEQTSLARGYGLMSFAACTLTVCLMRLHDEAEQPSPATMSGLFVGSLVGGLSHFFFTFFLVGAGVTIARSARQSADLRWACTWWLLLAFLPAGISHAFGAPAVLVQMRDISHVDWREVVQRFAHELGFRLEGTPGLLVGALSAGLLVWAVLAVPRAARRPLWTLLLVSVCLPMLARPVYLYPRFYLHVVALLAPALAWLIGERWLHGRAGWNTALLSSLIGFGVVAAHPWDLQSPVQLHTAAQRARALQQEYGHHFAVDTFISTAVLLYNGSTGRIINTQHPMPADVDRVLLVYPRSQKLQLPASFHEAERHAGTEHDLILIARDGS